MRLMKIKTALVLNFIFALLCGAGDDGLLFYCPFDGSADAAFAAGDKTAKCFPAPEFQSGVRGQALLIGGAPKESARRVSFSSEKNINLSGGTLSFWMNPLDWDGSGKGMNVIIQSGDSKNDFMVYKYWSDDNFIFLHGPPARGWTMATDRMDGWKKGRWRHVAAVWGPAEVKLFIDGNMVCATKTRFPFEPAAPLKPLQIGLESAIGKSLIDELRIYDRQLTPSEISALYLKDAENIESDPGLVTLGEGTPVIDGKAGDFEHSFSGCGFFNLSGRLSARQSRYLLSYDRNNLYFGLVSELENGKKISGGPEGAERAELLVITDAEPKNLRRFVFTPDGGVFEKNGKNGEWTPVRMTVKNTVAGGKWTLEAALPFADFGVKGAPDGKTWRFNIGRIFSSPAEISSAAPVAGRLDDRSHFINLNFRPDAPRIQLAGLVNVKDNYSTLDLSAKASNPASEIALLSISDSKRSYGEKTTVRTLWANGKSTPWKAPLPPSKELWTLRDFEAARIRVTEKINGKETDLYRLKYIRESPFNLRVLFFYTQERKRLSVSAKRGADGKIQVRFLRPDNSAAWESAQDIPAGAEYFNALFDLDLAKLTPGLYTVKINYLSPDGKAEEVYSQAYKIPGKDSTEFKKYTDIEADKVPAPWTPVKTDGNMVSVWGRTYDFSKGVLFSSLVSRGKELLGAPAALRLDGKDVAPVKDPELKKLSASDIAAEYDKRADLGALKVDSKIKTHFDGYCETTMTITPAKKGMEVKSLSLDIPLRRETATLVRDNLLSAIIGGKSGAVGDYWKGELAERPWIWVGNEKTGFNWVAENLQGWSFRDSSKNVELIRSGDNTVMRFNLVDTPMKLDAPKTVKFGFTLTPSRPLDPKLLRLREGKDWEMWCQPWKYFAYPDYKAVYPEKIESYLNRGGMNPPELFLYMGDTLTSPFSPEWGYWEEEWHNLGRVRNYGDWTGDFKEPKARDSYTYTGATLASETYRNFLNWKRSEFFTLAKTPLHPKATSYYFDIGLVAGPPLWRDDTGKEHSNLLIDETRELALNVYRMIKRTGPKAKVYSHQGWMRAMPLQNFAEIICGGEGVEGQMKKDGSYYNTLTPELFRATFIPDTWGIKMVFINMLTREMSKEQKLKFNLSDPKTATPVLHSYGYCLVHDTDIGAGFPELNKMVWAAQDKIGWDENVRFFSYWENDAVKLVSPQSNRILASAYTNNGKLLLAILNDTDKEENIKLSLDLDKLGVKAGLKGSDTWSPEKTYTLSGSFDDKIRARGFRLIAFEPGK
jgi:hypothetical protein